MSFSDELALFDLTRSRLRDILTDRWSGSIDVDGTLTAYAYWVCSDYYKHGGDWEATLHEYAQMAMDEAARDTEVERRELSLLKRVLAHAQASALPVLDIGAGWGRMARVYDDLQLRTVYLEPTTLGAHLMRRSGINRVVIAKGEALPFISCTFSISVIGWVLHHHSPTLDAVAIVREAARVTIDGGLLLSVEPLSARFDMTTWRGLLEDEGWVVDEVKEFCEMPDLSDETEHYVLIVATRHLQ